MRSVLLLVDGEADAGLLKDLDEASFEASIMGVEEEPPSDLQSRYDAVLVDGVGDVAARLKGVAWVRRATDYWVPVVVAFDAGELAHVSEAFALGADHYVTRTGGKIPSPLLSAVLSRACDVGRSRRERMVWEARFRTVMDAVPDGVWVLSRKGRVLEINSVLEALIGARREVILGG
ncbi:MAG: PAS domain-containing protein [Magnetococcales bacterium]|nr:PAS domain-containing protein [Magnetococcales bacterium]